MLRCPAGDGTYALLTAGRRTGRGRAARPAKASQPQEPEPPHRASSVEQRTVSRPRASRSRLGTASDAGRYQSSPVAAGHGGARSLRWFSQSTMPMDVHRSPISASCSPPPRQKGNRARTAGRRAVIQWPRVVGGPVHSPTHDQPGCMSMQRGPRDERPVMPRRARTLQEPAQRELIFSLERAGAGSCRR